jgi:hypothetical protein
MFIVDEEATARFQQVAAQVQQAREKADGSLSRLLAVEVLGFTDEDCDALGWGRLDA